MLLRSEPFVGQPLGINFLHADLYAQYKGCFGDIAELNAEYVSEKGYDVQGDKVYDFETPVLEGCRLCGEAVQRSWCRCKHCGWRFCMACLGQYLAHQGGGLKPVRGSCPGCRQELVWRDVLVDVRTALVSERRRTLPDSVARPGSGPSSPGSSAASSFQASSSTGSAKCSPAAPEKAAIHSQESLSVAPLMNSPAPLQAECRGTHADASEEIIDID